MSADFTGGIVDIITKEFPNSKQFSISFSSAYNPKMHYNDSYLTSKSSGTDFLGFDDGTRSLPTNPNANYSPIEIINNPILTEVTKKFTPTLAAERKSKGPNLSLSISGGNQFNIGESGNKLGFFGSLSYKNNSTFYKNAEEALALLDNAQSRLETLEKLIKEDKEKAKHFLCDLFLLAFEKRDCRGDHSKSSPSGLQQSASGSPHDPITDLVLIPFSDLERWLNI